MTEVADDAVVLRGLAGLLGVALLVGYVLVRHRVVRSTILPPGLVDALGAAAFAAASVALVIACVDQAIQTGASGVGFALSGAVVAVPASIFFASVRYMSSCPERDGRARAHPEQRRP